MVNNLPYLYSRYQQNNAEQYDNKPENQCKG